MASCLPEQTGGLQVLVVEEGIETGALLQPFVGRDAPVAVRVGRQVAMPQDDGVGELLVQACQQRAQTLALCPRARVGSLAHGIQPALVADTYRVLVVPPAVRPRLAECTPRVYGAVARHVVVVADVLHPASDVIPPALLQGVALPGPRGRAVQDNHRDGSHSVMQLVVVRAVSAAVRIDTNT